MKINILRDQTQAWIGRWKCEPTSSPAHLFDIRGRGLLANGDIDAELALSMLDFFLLNACSGKWTSNLGIHWRFSTILTSKKVHEVMFFDMWNYSERFFNTLYTEIKQKCWKNVTKNALFFLSRVPTHHSFIFIYWFLNELKHKVSIFKSMCGIFRFQSGFVFIKVFIFAKKTPWTLWLENVITLVKSVTWRSQKLTWRRSFSWKCHFFSIATFK